VTRFDEFITKLAFISKLKTTFLQIIDKHQSGKTNYRKNVSDTQTIKKCCKTKSFMIAFWYDQYTNIQKDNLGAGKSMIHTQKVKIDSNTISYKTNGLNAREIPVVMIHGLGSSSSDYCEVFNDPNLAGRLLIAPDLLGFGESDQPESFSYDLLDQAQLLNQLLDLLGFGMIDLVAHSMGGVVGILFACLNGDRVHRLIVIEPNMLPENAQISRRICDYGSEENFVQYFHPFHEKFNKPERPSTIRFYQSLGQTTPQILYKSASSLIKYANEKLYRDFLELQMPRDYLRGEKSWQYFPESFSSDFQTHRIGCHIIPDAGHGVMIDQPQAFCQVLSNIIEQPSDSTLS